MKKLILFVLIVSLALLITLGIPSSYLIQTNDENLGPATFQVASGTGMVTAGVGLLTQPGNLKIDVPNHTIKQVLLYWQGFMTTGTPVDETIILKKQGGSEVTITGEKIGDICPDKTNCPGNFPYYSATFRADITNHNLVTNGTNNFTVSGLTFSKASNGAGMIVIYDDGTAKGSIGILDGHDFAYHKSPGTLKTTNPKTLSFPASIKDRSATLHYLISSVEGSHSGGGVRPNSIEVTIGGTTTKCSDCLNSHSGQEWDTLDIPIVIPAGITSVSTQLFSRDDFKRLSLDPASLVWNFLAISIEDQLKVACLPGDGNKLIRGIDTAGVAGLVGTESWDNGSVDFSHSGTSFTNNLVPLNPALSDPGTDSMLRSSIYHGSRNNKELYMNVNGILPDDYNIYVWTWEDNIKDNFSLKIEGSNALQNQSSGNSGQWFKHGPYLRNVIDGSLNITASGGDANISGIEIRCAEQKDCAGVMGGKSVVDDCGVCDGKNASKGCDNVCNSGKTIDSCNVCGGGITDPTKCPVPDCNGVMGGKAVIDDCGICNGKNEAKGCDNVCFSGMTLDECKVCGGNNSDRGCDNICFSNKQTDACGVCGGSILDATQCISVNNCIIVEPTPEILAFEKRFQKLSKGLFKRIKDDGKRDAQYSCGVKSAKTIKEAKTIITELNQAALTIFTKGITVCGDSCVTLSFAEEVKKHQKKLNKLSKLATSLANKVKACYDLKQVKRDVKSGYVQDVVSQSKKELNSLIKDCSNTEVCSPRK